MPDLVDHATETVRASEQKTTSQFAIDLLALRRTRAPWRQRLIDAEQGFRFGLRSESTLFATLFAVVAIGCAAVVFRVSALEAAVLIVALTQSVAFTFVRLIVKEATGVTSTAHTLAAAAALASAFGGLLVAALLLGPKFNGLW